MISALYASWDSLGTFLSHLVGFLVALGASLGASWDLLGLCLLCLSLAPPGPGGWLGYASVPGPGPGSGPGPGLGPLRAPLTVVLAWTRWSSLGGPQLEVLNKFPRVRASPLDP